MVEQATRTDKSASANTEKFNRKKKNDEDTIPSFFKNTNYHD
jgi:hypothetical protein